MRLELDFESLIIGAVLGFLIGLVAGYLAMGVREGIVMERDETGRLVGIFPVRT